MIVPFFIFVQLHCILKKIQTMKQLIPILLSLLLLFSCETDDTGRAAPIIPPVETMIIDFAQITDNSKSATIPITNWQYSASSVSIWNLIVGTTFAVPIAAFRSTIGQEPTQINDLTWQWEYAVDGFTNQYAARLLGKIQASQIEWKMYITKTGTDSSEEFLWFEGTSVIGAKNGQWILYHSSEFPEKTVQIDWKKETDEVGEIKYTYVRELDNQGQPENLYGSTVTYGLLHNEFNIYVNVHTYNALTTSFTDTFIEWNGTNFDGHVKAEHFFNDDNWHCWDAQKNNINCN